ncbi:DUF1285 domain-containing protein [Aliikangiella maris]|uniref:DUF1285 domain-containing protein n=2 Tax=Aliikangiella maris TaxID=3162458 RepID=A0ABV2BW00_9GAMM
MSTTESLIKAIGDNPLPPVDQWNPQLCGEIDLIIKADGTWLYQGTPFTRHKMILLFSRVLKKEGHQYFLVTPVEKVAIKVEWMPFTIIDFEIIQQAKPVYRFFDNCENSVTLTEQTQINFSHYQSQQLPIIQIRKNLFASFSRSCYYNLLQTASIEQQNDTHQVCIQSNNLNFCLGEFSER